MTLKDEWYPKTKEEFDAYCRAMDEANEMAIQSAIQRDQEKVSEDQPSKD